MNTTNTAQQESLEERAARVAAELAEVRAEESRRRQVEYERLAAHQAAVDAEAVAVYNPTALEAEVTDAQQALRQAVADHPLTQALIDYYIACAKRREALDEYLGALGRQGRDISGAQYPRTDEPDLPELMNRIAQTAASDWRQAAEADFHQRRNTPEETK